MHAPHTLALLLDTMRVGRLGFNYVNANFDASKVRSLVEPIGSTSDVRAAHEAAINQALAQKQLAAALNHCKLTVKGPRNSESTKLQMAIRYLAAAGFARSLQDFWELLNDVGSSRQDLHLALSELNLQKPGNCVCGGTLFNLAEHGSLAERWLHQSHGYFNKAVWEAIYACPGTMYTLNKHRVPNQRLDDFLVERPDQSWFGLTPF